MTGFQRWIGLLCGLLLLIPAPAEAVQSPPELREALVGEIRKLNPLFATSNPVDRDIAALIFEGLTSINEYGEVIPDLAAGWIVSSDGLEYIVQLRQDVLWQDGLPFTAADVAYTFRTVRSADFPGDPTLRDFWRTVEIQVLDDYTIRFILVQPLASFPEQLRLGIVPAHALEGAPIATLDTHPFNLSPIGTGPYQREALYADGGQIRAISLRVAPNYRLRPEGQTGYAIDRLTFVTYPTPEEAIAAYQRGEVNSIGGLPPHYVDTLRNTTNMNVQTAVAPAVGVLIYNWQDDSLAYFHDQRLRLSFLYAIDRQKIMAGLSSRLVLADSPILPGSWAFNPEARYPAPDMAEAQRLLQLVSFEPPPVQEEPSEGPPAEDATPIPQVQIRRDFKILVIDDPGIAAVAFDVATQWSQLGFNVTLDIVDYTTLVSRLDAGQFDVALVEYNLAPQADPDQFSLWHESQIETGQNYGGMKINRISYLLAQARRDHNGLHRKQYYDDFQRTFTSSAPAIVLYHPLFIYVTDPRLQGVQLDFISVSSDRFRTIQDWTF
ncbi:MAG: hypothetical protein K8I82_20555 [Anaerolineae bacterium]|nr:hypothetical protein [Anaerolineae bacterium]